MDIVRAPRSYLILQKQTLMSFLLIVPSQTLFSWCVTHWSRPLTLQNTINDYEAFLPSSPKSKSARIFYPYQCTDWGYLRYRFSMHHFGPISQFLVAQNRSSFLWFQNFDIWWKMRSLIIYFLLCTFRAGLNQKLRQRSSPRYKIRHIRVVICRYKEDAIVILSLHFWWKSLWLWRSLRARERL